jgi:hypothetical protein
MAIEKSTEVPATESTASGSQATVSVYHLCKSGDQSEPICARNNRGDHTRHDEVDSTNGGESNGASLSHEWSSAYCHDQSGEPELPVGGPGAKRIRQEKAHKLAT